MAKIFLTNTGTVQAFSAPSDWPGFADAIECIGGGGGGASGLWNASYGQGGGGGAYSKTNGPITFGTGAPYQVGTGGAYGTESMSFAVDGGDTWFGNVAYNFATCAAKGGKGGSRANTSSTTRDGGDASLGVGDVKRSGGSGSVGLATSGGGGAAGPQSAGGDGGFGAQQTEMAGAGGGAGNGGGGASTFTSTPGAGGTSVNGGGSGGQGAGFPGGSSVDHGHPGSTGTEWDSTHGTGGGGGSGAGYYWNASHGGNGALYGGGGGGGRTPLNGDDPTVHGGNGAQGLIVITYTPATSSKTITATLVNESGVPFSGLSGLKWAFWDYATPDLIFSNAAVPSAGGSTGSTDSSGVFSAIVGSSTLSDGQYGWLVITNSDGTLSQSPKHSAYSGPVVVRV